MENMQETIVVKVTTKHFRRAVRFMSNSKCPLALAIRDVIGNDVDVSVGPWEVFIEDKNYDIEGGFLIDASRWGYGLTIDEMIDKAKAHPALRYPTKYITLYNKIDETIEYNEVEK